MRLHKLNDMFGTEFDTMHNGAFAWVHRDHEVLTLVKFYILFAAIEAVFQTGSDFFGVS
jgi:hypothetical protein